MADMTTCLFDYITRQGTFIFQNIWNCFFLWLCMYVCVCTFICLWMSIYDYVYVCIYKYMYIHIHAHSIWTLLYTQRTVAHLNKKSKWNVFSVFWYEYDTHTTRVITLGRNSIYVVDIYCYQLTLLYLHISLVIVVVHVLQTNNYARMEICLPKFSSDRIFLYLANSLYGPYLTYAYDTNINIPFIPFISC